VPLPTGEKHFGFPPHLKEKFSHESISFGKQAEIFLKFIAFWSRTRTSAQASGLPEQITVTESTPKYQERKHLRCTFQKSRTHIEIVDSSLQISQAWPRGI